MRKTINFLSTLCIIGGFVLILGTVGSTELNKITFSQSVYMGLIGIVTMGCGIVTSALTQK